MLCDYCHYRSGVENCEMLLVAMIAVLLTCNMVICIYDPWE